MSDESFLALAGTKLVRDPDLEADMRAAYVRMRADEDAGQLHGTIDSMWVGTPTSREITFLHGYGGRFALPCWQIAHAVPGAVVSCPSIGTQGDWWNHAADVKAGKKAIVIGLSNGGIGLSRIASTLDVAGVVVISGADPAAACPKVPLLVIQGKTDTMSSAAAAKAYATKCKGTYVELDAGHFAMLRKPVEAEKAIRDWVAAR